MTRNYIHVQDVFNNRHKDNFEFGFQSLFLPGDLVDMDLVDIVLMGQGNNADKKYIMKDQVRKDWVASVTSREAGLCAVCSNPGVDVHHIIERKLFSDGGYHIDNGILLCSQDHWKAETTEHSCEYLRECAGIMNIHLPQGFDSSLTYDKWGNTVLEDGMRVWGPLQEDTGCQRALATIRWTKFQY